jgi:hypothetical protein
MCRGPGHVSAAKGSHDGLGPRGLKRLRLSQRRANKALSGRSAYWSQQRKSGRAILRGAVNGDYWGNAAVMVFEAASCEAKPFAEGMRIGP